MLIGKDELLRVTVKKQLKLFSIKHADNSRI
jgi:hypothetical protein